MIVLAQACEAQKPLLNTSSNTGDNLKQQIAKPIRPKEFRLPTAVPFVGLFVVLMILLSVLFAKARPYGKLSRVFCIFGLVLH